MDYMLRLADCSRPIVAWVQPMTELLRMPFVTVLTDQLMQGQSSLNGIKSCSPTRAKREIRISVRVHCSAQWYHHVRQSICSGHWARTET